MSENLEQTVNCIELTSSEMASSLFGSFDENIRALEKETGARVRIVENGIEVSGDPECVQMASEVVNRMIDMVHRGEQVDSSRVRYAVVLVREGNGHLISEVMSDVVLVTHKGKPIKCRTLGQKKYVDAIRHNEIVFGIGPAGTGKTYLAMAMAVLALKNKEISRIILTRPAVEAGEKLGFLPGDLQNKVDPYLRPLYDALYEMIGAEAYQRLVERGSIEVAPMAYMRGRTLNDAFVVLDEAQNTTVEQMKMFLTRMGSGSRMVITGDVTQIDLPAGKKSGLVDASQALSGIEGLEIIRLTGKDVVRHEMVQKIIKAYEKHEKHRTRES